jgi:hypothetical protein
MMASLGRARVIVNLTGVDWARQQCVEMTAREGLAAALGAVCSPTFRAKSERMLVINPAET